VLTNVEMLMKDTPWGFMSLWKTRQFTDKLTCITFDEAHCISRWAGFRPDYQHVGRLKYFLPNRVRFFAASATMPSLVLDDIADNLRLRKGDQYVMNRSNDRPNIHLTVREMIHPANSFLDLAFLIPDNPTPGWKPPKFLIFFDDISESIRAARFLHKRLPPEQRDMLRWFNSDMSTEFREESCEDLREGRTWGLMCTDSFGMVSKPPAIHQVHVNMINTNRV